MQDSEKFLGNFPDFQIISHIFIVLWWLRYARKGRREVSTMNEKTHENLPLFSFSRHFIYQSFMKYCVPVILIWSAYRKNMFLFYQKTRRNYNSYFELSHFDIQWFHPDITWCLSHKKIQYLLICSFFISHGTVGDIISSSIICDGSFLTHTSIIDKDSTYDQNLFTTDYSHIIREIKKSGDFSSFSSVNSSGSLGITEYNGLHLMQSDNTSPWCVFNQEKSKDIQQNEIITSGLLNNAEFLSTRMINHETTSAKTIVNGTGFILLKRNSANTTSMHNEKNFVHGLMQVSDYVVFNED